MSTSSQWNAQIAENLSSGSHANNIKSATRGGLSREAVAARVHLQVWRIVVEIHENGAAASSPRLDVSGPVDKRLMSIVAFVPAARSVPADVDKIRRALPWRWSIMIVRHTEGDVVCGQNLQNAMIVPARMPEFDAVAMFPRQQLQE